MNRADFSFNERVAQRYNRQRAHPPHVSVAIGEAIAAQAGDGARVLEIGVGTGRIALPVANTGLQVVGFDLSGEMLQQVGETAPDNLSLLRADMHRLPFLDNTFDATLAVHVLHLAKDWQAVLSETARVLRSSGAFIQGDDWIDPQSVVGKMRNELRRYVAELAPDFMPPAAGISKQQFLADLGGTEVTEITAAEWVVEVSPNDRLEDIENRMDAESWVLPEALFDRVLQHMREFAADNWDDLEQKQPVTRRFVLKVTRGSWKTAHDGTEPV